MAPKIMFKCKIGSSAQDPSSSQDSSEFRSLTQKHVYQHDFLHMSIIFSKTARFDDIASLSIQNMFEQIGLLGFYQLSGRCCERAIRLFYANMHTGETTESLKTYMFGKDVEITPADVNAIVGFPYDDDDVVSYYHSARDCDFIKGRRGIEFLRMVLQNADVDKFEKPRSKDLNVKARVVHNMITHTILPRDGHRDLVNYMDLYVMHRLYTRHRFNPGSLILSHMKEISRTSNKNLAYRDIHKLLVHFSVPIPTTESMRSERPTEVYDRLHLKRMGVIEADGIWIFKGVCFTSSSTASASEDIAMEETLPTEEAQPPFVEQSLSDDTSIRQLLEELTVGQRELMLGQREIRQSQRELLEGQREIRECQRELREAQRELYREHGLLSARLHRWMETQEEESVEAPPPGGDAD